MMNLRMQGVPLDGYSGAIETARARRHIGLVLFDGFSLLLAGAIVEALHLANVLSDGTSDRISYVFHFLSAKGGAVSSASSVFVKTVKCEESRRAGGYHAVFVASGKNAVEMHGRNFDCLRTVVEQAGMVFPIGHGQRPLDVSGPGWLESRVVRAIEASEWMHRLSGSASPVDAALTLVERDLGSEIARRVARSIELPLRWHFRALAGKRAAAKFSEQIQTSVRWLETNASRAITIDEAAQVALMSTRNFLRRFKVETGTTPSEYLLHVRIELCCRLLASTSLPVDKVARRCGFGSGGQLSKIFRKHLESTPTEYRARVQQPNALV